MSDPLDPVAIGANFRRALTGGPPPNNLIDSLGGWNALEVLAPTLVDDPLLTVAMSLLARDLVRDDNAPGDLASIRPAAVALAGAVLDSGDPLQFTQNIDTICRNDLLAGMVGPMVAAKCLTFAVPPRADGDDPPAAAVIRHAVALEAVARLAVLGHASKNKLMGVLEDVAEPQPRRYAQAVVRTVALAFDHWMVDDDVADVIDILSGERAPAYSTRPAAVVLARNDEYRQDITSDATWTKANVEIARALRSNTSAEAIERFTAAVEALDFVGAIDDRDDATVLHAALTLLLGLLRSLGGTDTPQDAAAWDASIAAAEEIAQQVRSLAVSSYGLTHWSNDRKLAILEGWAQLARDLAFLRDQLDRDALYDAAVILDDILAIYSASRSYDITRNDQGAEQVLKIIRPAIARGFAARAGLLRNLTDHTERLRQRVTAADPGDDAEAMRARLATAETVLQGARVTMLDTTGPPGKHHEREAAIPPLLAELFGSHPTFNTALASVDPRELTAVAADIADRQAASDPDPDVVVTAVRKRVLADLTACPDFAGEVVPAASRVLDQLVKFVARRMNTQESTKSYLFDPEADEHDLHTDLYDWLSQGQLGSATNVEVQEVGAGRVDIQIGFPGFHFYLELKADETTVPLAGKAAYIKQTVSYQASGIRIGFLVVLRLKSAKDKGPSPHLTELVSHTVVSVQGGLERHVVMLEVPGNQTKPSNVH